MQEPSSLDVRVGDPTLASAQRSQSILAALLNARLQLAPLAKGATIHPTNYQLQIDSGSHACQLTWAAPLPPEWQDLSGLIQVLEALGDDLKLFDEIASAFPGCVTAFSDSFIEENPGLPQLDTGVDSHLAVPAYMAWCARNWHRPAELIHDYTINALAELGRSKNRQLTRLDFKHRCTSEQKAVVLKFLRVYLEPHLLANAEQVERSIKQWS